MEVRITPEKPVKWMPEDGLAILTDGGDGGFFDASAPTVHDDPAAVIDGYVGAFSPNGSGAGTVCVLRRSGNQPDPDAALFTTGYGDGGYPTFVGLDRAGRLRASSSSAMYCRGDAAGCRGHLHPGMPMASPVT